GEERGGAPPAAGGSGRQEVGDGDRLVAVDAEAADVEPEAEDVAALAALDAEVALLAARALVDDLVPGRPAGRRWGGALAEPVGALAVGGGAGRAGGGGGAVGGAGAGGLAAADGAPTLSDRRARRSRNGTVTNGVVGQGQAAVHRVASRAPRVGFWRRR